MITFVFRKTLITLITMKKLLLLLAACGLVVACGGEKKDDKKSGEQATEQTVKAEEQPVEPVAEEQTVAEEQPVEQVAEEQTVAEVFDQVYEAIEAEDYETAAAILMEADSVFGEDLTPEQEAELEAYAEKNMEKMEVIFSFIMSLEE